MTQSLCCTLAAAAKSRQSCPTLCDPIDCGPPGSSIPGFLQARILEWVAISFSIPKVKLSIQKTKIIASGPITSWQIDGGKAEAVTDFVFFGPKITADGDCSNEIKRHLLFGRKFMTNLVQFSSVQSLSGVGLFVIP